MTLIFAPEQLTFASLQTGLNTRGVIDLSDVASDGSRVRTLMHCHAAERALNVGVRGLRIRGGRCGLPGFSGGWRAAGTGNV
jgi:hypothetical protein